MRFPLALVATVAFAARLGAQTGVPDQHGPYGSAILNTATSLATWQQQVRVGVAGVLEGFSFQMYSTAPGGVDVIVRLGAAWSTTPPLWGGIATTVGLGTGNWETVYVDCSSAGIGLQVDDLLVIELVANNFGSAVYTRASDIPPPVGPAYPEPLYLNNIGPYAGGAWTLGFQSWMLPVPQTPQIAVVGACPGPAAIRAQSMTPGGLVRVGWGTLPGTWPVPSGPCAGALLPLVSPTSLFTVTADALGEAWVPGLIPPQACGVVSLVGFDVASCVATDPVPL